MDKCIISFSGPFFARWNHIHCKAAERLRDGRSHGTVDDSDMTQPQSHKLTNGFHGTSTLGGKCGVSLWLFGTLNSH